MVSINYQGRFGNNLFQYFTALILSNKFNQKISNVLSNNILKHNLINNDINYNKNLIVDDNNINDILKLDTIDSNLILNGFFQNKDLLKHFNKNQNIINNNKELIKGTFVHVRLGDIVNDSRSCKIQYYKKALQGLNGGCISSDSPNNDIIKKLSDEFNLEIFESSPEQTIIEYTKY
jgi:hypothetical protein